MVERHPEVLVHALLYTVRDVLVELAAEQERQLPELGDDGVLCGCALLEGSVPGLHALAEGAHAPVDRQQLVVRHPSPYLPMPKPREC